MRVSDRMDNLGTETAFAVGGQAAAWAAKGNKVYPFHLGDMNIITPENIRKATMEAASSGKTGYVPAAGLPALREALAKEISASRGVTYQAESISIQPGGKPVIGKFLNTVMDPGDEVLYPNPGYPIYESMIEFLGGTAVPYRFQDTADGFALDMNSIESRITAKTRALIYNNYQNPLGAESSPEEMAKLASLARAKDLWVLADEAYFDVRYEGKSSSMAALEGMLERTVILYTFSKKFAMTGWRLGAAIGPPEIAEKISQLNTNDESCTNHFIQYGGIEALTGDQSAPTKILATLKERRDACVEALNDIEGISCHKPSTTFYLFPKVTEAMKIKGYTNLADFQGAALKETGVSFCTRHHFGKVLPGETEKYARFAYSGIDIPEIQEGLRKLKAWIEG